MNQMRILLLLLTVVIVIALAVFSSQPVAAHGGGIDGIGCHNDTKARNYHCH